MANPTQDDIIRTLEKLRTDTKRQRYMRAPDTYKNYMPAQLPTKFRDNSLAMANLDETSQIGKNATALAVTRAQNRAAYAKQVDAQKALERARSAAAVARDTAREQKALATKKGKTWLDVYNPNGIQVGNKTYNGQGQVISGGNPTDHVNVKGVNPYASIKSYQWGHGTVQLNSSVANRFLGFLHALQAKGYRPYSVGGYSNRNIAGTNTRSLHSYGMAIDINPAQNPVTYGHVKTNLPPGVGALAAKYGLAWGGAWNGPKFDSMHFSVPYFGTK